MSIDFYHRHVDYASPEFSSAKERIMSEPSEREEVFIEVFTGPVLAVTDGHGSGCELAGPHRPEWGETLHRFKITEMAAKDLVANMQYHFAEVNCARDDCPGPKARADIEAHYKQGEADERKSILDRAIEKHGWERIKILLALDKPDPAQTEPSEDATREMLQRIFAREDRSVSDNTTDALAELAALRDQIGKEDQQ